MSRYDTYQRKAVCPYFRTANEKSIYCDGIIPGTQLRTRFPNFGACHYYVRTVCCDLERCSECKIAQSITKK